MTSRIDPTMPVHGSPTTQSVRDNFAIAASEISALQAATGGIPPAMSVTGGGTITVPAGTLRVYVTTTSAVTIDLPPNDCMIVDRTGNRGNPITVQAPGTTINGQATSSIAIPWQAANFLWDGTAYGIA